MSWAAASYVAIGLCIGAWFGLLGSWCASRRVNRLIREHRAAYNARIKAELEAKGIPYTERDDGEIFWTRKHPPVELDLYRGMIHEDDDEPEMPEKFVRPD